MARIKFTNRINQAVNAARSNETSVGVVLAVLVGVIAGLGAVVFRELISFFHFIYFDGGGEALGFLHSSYVVIIPALGGIIVGPLIYFLAREAKGHGVPEVMEAVAVENGKIRPRVAFVKILASSITIGSGGSAGREGPIVQIGSAAGSSIAQWFRLPPEAVKTLVACGAAGGISATFNAPIAGAFFALEIILARAVTARFALIVISSVVADFTAQAFLGRGRAFTVPTFGIESNWEMGLYVILGVAAAFAAFVFVKALYFSEDLFEELSTKFRIPPYVLPVIGGLMMGAIGFYKGDLFGVGYGDGPGGIDGALVGNMALSTLFILGSMKILATSLTIGSGGSGGIFAPSLFIGAMLGTGMGVVFNNLFPDSTAPAAAYGIVGMAAVFAGGARAPLTAITILFEMTGNYQIILPLMLAVGVSLLISRALSRESIYTMKLIRRGIDVQSEQMHDVMEQVTVGETMTADFPTVLTTTSISELSKKFRVTGHHGFPVVDESGDFCGVVTVTDVEIARADGKLDYKVADIAINNPFVAYPDQSLLDVLRASEEDYGRIPVVERNNKRKLLGVLRRYDIIRAHRKLLAQADKTIF